MKKINIEKNRITSLPLLKTPTLHCESDIYCDKTKLYKILNPELRNRQSIIEELNDAKIPGTVIPRELLVSGSLLSHYFVGYSMDYYKDYYELYSVFDKNLPLEQRKKIITKMNTIYRKMIDMGYRYWDIRQGNIITNGKDVKYTDMDSTLRLFDRARYTDQFAREKLFTTSLSLLLEQDYTKLMYDENSKRRPLKTIYSFVDTLTSSKELRAIIKCIYSTMYWDSIDMNHISDIELANMLSSTIYFDDVLDEFTEDNISSSLKLIK